jgi:hypothetical protein
LVWILALNVRIAAVNKMAVFGKTSSENGKGYKKLLPDLNASNAKIISKNIKLSAVTCRNGRILTINCKTTPVKAHPMATNFKG